MKCYLRGILFICIGLLIIEFSMSCDSPGDSQDDLQRDIERDLERELSSVDGEWTGMSFDDIALSIQFTLTQNGEQVSGSGVYSDANTPNPIAITVTGTFLRPTLSLTFSGIVFEGVNVTGQLIGDYETVGGITVPLSLIGQGVSRDIDILLQESP